MKFCSQCGATVSRRIPAGDDRERNVCDACDAIYYDNPKIIVGCIPIWQEKVLLCKRAIRPREGYWTLPAGFMENGESSQDGAARETLEEANARVDVTALFSYLNIPRINQVYVLFRAELLDLDFSPGDESLEVRLFGEDEVPWSDIAFPAIELTLEHYFLDRQMGEFRTHVGDIHWRAGEPRPSHTKLR